MVLLLLVLVAIAYFGFFAAAFAYKLSPVCKKTEFTPSGRSESGGFLEYAKDIPVVYYACIQAPLTKGLYVRFGPYYQKEDGTFVDWH